MSDLTVYWVRENGDYVCSFMYDEDLVTAIKGTIRYPERRWDPVRKVWIFSPTAWPRAKRIFQSYYYDVPAAAADAYDEPVPEVEVGQDAYATLCLTPDAPLELIEKAYLILAKQRHPDTGGTHEQFIALNAAYQQLRTLRLQEAAP